MEIRIALVGIGGYGGGYAKELLEALPHRNVRFIAGIDPEPERCPVLPDLRRAGVLIFPSLNQFLLHGQADLIILSSPIHLHAEQTQLALAHGSNVLCEKPLCAVVQDARQMAEAERKSGKFVAIGYQLSFTEEIQKLKKNIAAGDFGTPKRLKTRILWPRWQSYYHRNQWAGRIKSGSGEWVLDSPANNAMAHYLHNALYILGDTLTTSAHPVSVQAELYRANPIENYDSAVIRVKTDKNVEVLFYGSHTVPEEAHPTFYYEFEDAIIQYTVYSGSKLIAHFKDGRIREYGDPSAPGKEWGKLWQCVDSVRTGEPVACGIEAAAAHTLCINGAQESIDIQSIPADDIRQETRDNGDTLAWVVGMQEAITQSYNSGCLPGECTSFPWVKTGEVIDLTRYNYFPRTLSR